MASGFVKIAMDEFYSHNPNNLTGLVQRYWTMVEDEVAGIYTFRYLFFFSVFFLFILTIRILIGSLVLIVYVHNGSYTRSNAFASFHSDAIKLHALAEEVISDRSAFTID